MTVRLNCSRQKNSYREAKGSGVCAVDDIEARSAAPTPEG